MDEEYEINTSITDHCEVGGCFDFLLLDGVEEEAEAARVAREAAANALGSIIICRANGLAISDASSMGLTASSF